MFTVSESLSQLEVLVVDCQATAPAPHGHLLEMAWARASTTTTRADARLIALPHGEHIPAAVTRLTGISERMSQGGVKAHVAPIPPAYRRSVAARRELFTIASFGRLRVLTAELKRLSAAGAPVTLRLGAGPALDGSRLAAALWWV
jgi:hypothetical protein